MQKMQSGDFSRFWSEEGGLFDTIPSFLAIIDLLDKLTPLDLKNNVDILDKLQATRPKFDAITFETYMFVGRVVQDYLGIEVYLPVVSITHDTKTSVLLGEPIMPSYLSGYFTNFGNVMTFKERTINTMSYVLGNYYLQYPKWKKLQDPTQDLSIKGNYYQSPYLFINSNPYIDFPRPMIPKTIQVGGITVDVAYLKSHKVD
uniref:glucuronosyltransferase n=3 Tax=Caenorhabditis japonica TaxID=281687 RepID=A0A8R1ISR1_CAEJA